MLVPLLVNGARRDETVVMVLLPIEPLDSPPPDPPGTVVPVVPPPVRPPRVSLALSTTLVTVVWIVDTVLVAPSSTCWTGSGVPPPVRTPTPAGPLPPSLAVPVAWRAA